MTYNEFMNRPMYLYNKIQHQVEKVQRLELISLSTTAPLRERIQTSRDNTQEKKYAALADAQRQLNDMVEELNTVSDEVKAFLYENLSIEEADVLEWRYVNCKSINEIAILKNLTYSGASTKINRAEKNAKKAYFGKTE